LDTTRVTSLATGAALNAAGVASIPGSMIEIKLFRVANLKDTVIGVCKVEPKNAKADCKL
jgi:hypothetical protein